MLLIECLFQRQWSCLVLGSSIQTIDKLLGGVWGGVRPPHFQSILGGAALQSFGLNRPRSGLCPDFETQRVSNLGMYVRLAFFGRKRLRL